MLFFFFFFFFKSTKFFRSFFIYFGGLFLVFLFRLSSVGESFLLSFSFFFVLVKRLFDFGFFRFSWEDSLLFILQSTIDPEKDSITLVCVQRHLCQVASMKLRPNNRIVTKKQTKFSSLYEYSADSFFFFKPDLVNVSEATKGRSCPLKHTTRITQAILIVWNSLIIKIGCPLFRNISEDRLMIF